MGNHDKSNPARGAFVHAKTHNAEPISANDYDERPFLSIDTNIT